MPTMIASPPTAARMRMWVSNAFVCLAIIREIIHRPAACRRYDTVTMARPGSLFRPDVLARISWHGRLDESSDSRPRAGASQRDRSRAGPFVAMSSNASILLGLVMPTEAVSRRDRVACCLISIRNVSLSCDDGKHKIFVQYISASEPFE